MAEKPILFNTEMVRAIQAGLKTQTRRIIKGLPLYPPFFEEEEGHGWLEDSGNGSFYVLEAFSKVQPGDVLWVRETWCRWWMPHGGWHYCYKASDPNGNKRPTGPEYDDRWETMPWRPSIHMPKEAARIFLRVKNVWAERLQGITKQEAIEEGITRLFDYLTDEEFEKRIAPYSDFKKKSDFGWTNYLYKKDANHLYSDYQSPIDSFASLWNSTIKKADLPRYGWDANPWVWVIEFERCEHSKEG